MPTTVAARRVMTVVCAIAFMLVGPSVAGAQTLSRVGPSIQAIHVGVQRSQSPAPLVVSSRGYDQRQGAALMIVGGAAVLVGAVMEGKPGTIFMVGGAVVGLYGLYKYL